MQLSLFRLENEIFGIDITPVQEIIKMPELVRVPLSPPALLGLTNLRGKVIPVISMRRLFGISDNEFNESTRALVVNFGESIAVVVDQVLSVISVGEDQIEDANNGEGFVKSEFLKGIVKDVGSYKLVAILELESVIKENLKFELKQASYLHAHSLKELDSDTKDDSKQRLEEERQIVCFSLQDEEYAFYIDSVQEIVQWPDRIVQIPNSPDYFLGIMKLRERFVPLVSLAALFGSNGIRKESSRIIVVNNRERSFGIVVDKVNEVMRVSSSCFKQVPEFMEQESKMISEICNIKDRLISVLSPDSVFDLELKEVEKKMEDLKDNKETIEENEEENHMVVFKLGQEEYAVSINFVQEIVRMPESITAIPNAPDGVEGIMNLRGTVLPIIDLRQKMGMEQLEKNERQRILVFLMDSMKVGFIVDSVTEVIRLPQKSIEPAPISVGDNDFVEAIANLTEQKRIIQILNPKSLVSEVEMESIKEDLKEAQGDKAFNSR